MGNQARLGLMPWATKRSCVVKPGIFNQPVLILNTSYSYLRAWTVTLLQVWGIKVSFAPRLPLTVFKWGGNIEYSIRFLSFQSLQK